MTRAAPQSDPDAPGTRLSPYAVSEVVRRAHRVLDRAAGVIWMEGEVQSVSRPNSGHVYFSLADDSAAMPVVMWRKEAKRLGFAIERGMSLVCRGRLGIYQRDGTFQLYAQFAEPKGAGAKALALKQLREKLTAEGLFAPERKRPLPKLPRRVGIVTARRGAAIRDIIKTIKMRFPCHIVCCDVAVQGEHAASQIAQALSRINRYGVDVIIVGRGGGSEADLSAFNDEAIVRAIAASVAPVISAVGHEVDVSLCDLVADARAATPTMAGEMAVPLIDNYLRALARFEGRLQREIKQQIGGARQRLDLLALQAERAVRAHITDRKSQLAQREARVAAASPSRQLADKRDQLRTLRERLHAMTPARRIADGKLTLSQQRALLDETMTEVLTLRRQRLGNAAATLDALSPLAVLGRGYTIASRGDTIVDSVAALAAGDAISLRFADGTATATIDDTEEDA